MSSVDRVGRYFPLTVARVVPQHVAPFQVLPSAANWFSHIQSVMLAALDGDLMSNSSMVGCGMPRPVTSIP